MRQTGPPFGLLKRQPVRLAHARPTGDFSDAVRYLPTAGRHQGRTDVEHVMPPGDGRVGDKTLQGIDRPDDFERVRPSFDALLNGERVNAPVVAEAGELSHEARRARLDVHDE